MTVVGGCSAGGLMAAYVGLQHPELFGRVLAQSGSGGAHATRRSRNGWRVNTSRLPNETCGSTLMSGFWRRRILPTMARAC